MAYKHEGFAKHNHKFHVGQKVRTRGDIGGFPGTITKIHNDHFCQIKAAGKLRHMNMAFIEPRRPLATHPEGSER